MGKKTISDNKKIVIKSLVDAGMPYRKVNEVTGVSLGLIGKIVRQFEADKGLVEWYQRKWRSDVADRAPGDPSRAGTRGDAGPRTRHARAAWPWTHRAGPQPPH